MKYSLLYRTGIAPPSSVGERTLYHLSLDRTFERICKDTEHCEFFLQILSCSLTSEEDIGYRREILTDFLQNPSLFGELNAHLGKFAELQTADKRAGKETLRISANKQQSVNAAKNLLQVQAYHCKKAFLLVRTLGEILSKADLHSAGLLAVRESACAMSHLSAFEDMLSFCASFEDGGLQFSDDFRVTLDNDGYLVGTESVSNSHIHITDPDRKQKQGLFTRKIKETVYPCERLYPTANEFYPSLIIHSISDITLHLRSFTSQLFERYLPLYTELRFYDTALAYAHRLQEKGVSLVFPEIVAEGETSITDLRDLHLLIIRAEQSTVIPNDVHIPPDGRLAVFGENGSGKTVFLRSFATALLLAQAGLPIPARRAIIRPYVGIVTQFSESEKEFVSGNDAGRFEQEVRELSAMLDTVTRGSLVFLNETFQSTSYEEGAEGLYHILRYLNKHGVSWILVTHLRALLPRFSEDGTPLLRTGEGHKIVHI